MSGENSENEDCTSETTLMLESRSWSALPDHIIISILAYLPFRDRYVAGTVCKTWQNCYRSPYLWKKFDFCFDLPENRNRIKCLDLYAQYLVSVNIELDQHETGNRINACQVLRKLAQVEGRRLSELRIRFTGENPLFYAGYEFVDELKVLFGPGTLNSRPQRQLQHVDLSGLSVAYDDSVFDLLSMYNPQLQSLNILNRILVCKVTPQCIQRVVERCRKLTDLRVFHCSLSDSVLTSLAQPDRTPPRHLGILCRREEKYSRDLSSEAWSELRKQAPELRVVLGFDHTCPLVKVSTILKAEIPVRELRLETYTMIFEEVELAAQQYGSTLEKVVLQTRNSPQLAHALLDLCRKCVKLSSLQVFCVLDKEIVDKILELRPLMRENNSYRLKWKPENELCVVGREEGD